MGTDTSYFDELKKRRAETHVHRDYQLIGLEIAQILGDEAHKSLYIKLVKEYGTEAPLRLAKEIAERKDIRAKGAYFMRIWSLHKTEIQNDKRNSRRKR